MGSGFKKTTNANANAHTHTHTHGCVFFGGDPPTRWLSRWFSSRTTNKKYPRQNTPACFNKVGDQFWCLDNFALPAAGFRRPCGPNARPRLENATECDRCFRARGGHWVRFFEDAVLRGGQQKTIGAEKRNTTSEISGLPLPKDSLGMCLKGNQSNTTFWGPR